MAKNKSTAPENAEEIKNEEVATDTIEIDVENIDPVALAQAKMEEYKDLAQRTQADFDNFRKRNAEAVKQARADGGNDVVVSMLPVLDTVEIAINMISDEATKSGVQLIQKKFQEVFAKYGVKEIDALGNEFDPNLHNAVMQVEDAENAGKVVEVLQKGYTRDGKVIRPSMVKVAN
ncbi:MAG: nucleotide exchange factor GrpE [Clostridia bacterium]|nr:nucleotide exchange factor GrpE [Clostridia bacterium]MBO7177499.1 nucleotide exchange factor GrpE [Clostridia bacterium]